MSSNAVKKTQQKGVSICSSRCDRLGGASLTKPIIACVRSVSIVTRPPLSLLYQVSSCVSDRISEAPEKLGYGNAYLTGFKQARGRYIVIMDGDLTYDPLEMPEFIRLLESGKADFVIGTRLKGHIKKGAMSALHRYVGNPVLTWMLNILFGAGISDSHCGMRAMTREALDVMKDK